MILKYKDHLALKSLSKARIGKYVEILSLIARTTKKDFDKLTKEDVEKFVADIHSRKYSPWTKQIYKVMLRKFLTWMNGDELPAVQAADETVNVHSE